MPAVLISVEHVRRTLIDRASGGDPDWHEIREAPGLPRWALLERYSADTAGGAYGDLAEGAAHVALYGRGDQRVEVHTYPERIQAVGDRFDDQYGVQQRIESWTVNMHDGEDRGHDSTEIDYSDASAMLYRTLDSAQAAAQTISLHDLAGMLDDGLVS